MFLFSRFLVLTVASVVAGGPGVVAGVAAAATTVVVVVAATAAAAAAAVVVVGGGGRRRSGRWGRRERVSLLIIAKLRRTYPCGNVKSNCNFVFHNGERKEIT